VDARGRLVRLLKLAHAGERAAAIAYAGHWRSVRDEAQREAIRRIEAEEWDHRARLRVMLAELGERPARLRELAMIVIGCSIAVLCFVGGWFVPMYGAGKIERRNVWEYVDAARFAHEAGLLAYVEPLLQMAAVEWDHERFFRELIVGKWQLRFLKLWQPLPPRESLREAAGIEQRAA
jgi:rubrerythrin